MIIAAVIVTIMYISDLWWWDHTIAKVRMSIWKRRNVTCLWYISRGYKKWQVVWEGKSDNMLVAFYAVKNLTFEYLSMCNIYRASQVIQG